MFFLFFADLFHVEQIKFLFFSLIFTLLLVSCTKHDPNPELKDPIYLDIKSQMALAEKSLAEANAKIKEFNDGLASALPQTGQTKTLQRKVFYHEKQRDLLLQQIKYWLIRSEDRAKQVRIDYAKSLNGGPPWPNPKEFEVYLSEKKLRLAKIEWDAKQRLEDYKSDLKIKQAPAHGAPKGGH